MEYKGCWDSFKEFERASQIRMCQGRICYRMFLKVSLACIGVVEEVETDIDWLQ